jgi:hypothetical protein
VCDGSQPRDASRQAFGLLLKLAKHLETSLSIAFAVAGVADKDKFKTEHSDVLEALENCPTMLLGGAWPGTGVVSGTTLGNLRIAYATQVATNLRNHAAGVNDLLHESACAVIKSAFDALGESHPAGRTLERLAAAFLVAMTAAAAPARGERAVALPEFSRALRPLERRALAWAVNQWLHPLCRRLGQELPGDQPQPCNLSSLVFANAGATVDADFGEHAPVLGAATDDDGSGDDGRDRLQVSQVVALYFGWGGLWCRARGDAYTIVNVHTHTPCPLPLPVHHKKTGGKGQCHTPAAADTNAGRPARTVAAACYQQ